MRVSAVLIASGACFLAGCVTTPDPGPGQPIAQAAQLYEKECALGTQASDVQQFHALLYYPYEHSLRSPGMVVGIEKSADHLVKRGAEKVASQQPERKSAEDRLVHRLAFEGSKSMFISHIVETSARGIVSETPLYSAYDKAQRIEEKYAKPNQPVDCKGQPVAEFDAYGDSWKAVKAVKTQLSNALNDQKYTDVIVISMGWNTNQVEAVQNYNSLIRHLAAAAKSTKTEFAPYVIGITWPSEWISPWVDAAVRAVSVVNKANDADEVGASWMGAVIQHGVLEVTQEPKNKNLRVTVLGHSFGARATSMAVCNGIVLKPPADEGFSSVPPPPGAVAWLVGLQGAYSLNRNLPDGAGLFKLRYEGCNLAKRQLLTASVNDTAAEFSGNVIWDAPFAGQQSAWKSLKAGEHSRNFNFYKATSKGGLDPAVKSPSGAAWDYVDASDLVFFKSYGTGAGAHSDIYRPEMGKLIWSFLNTE